MGSCSGGGRALFSLSMASATGTTGLVLLPLALGVVLLACHTARPTQPPVTLGPYTAADDTDDAPHPVSPMRQVSVTDDDDDELECTTDADCVITTFTDCCTCCECARPPYAVNHRKLHTLEAQCAIADCSVGGCNTKRCPPCTTPTITPACEDGTCVAR